MNLRQYKKKYFICKDDNGKMIYAGDTVELFLPCITKIPYQTIVYWNKVDGAFVESFDKKSDIPLRKFLGQQPYKFWDYGEIENKPKMVNTKCIKVKSFYDC